MNIKNSPLSVTHILYLSEKPRVNPFSGAENHVMELVASLAKSGADVELLVMLWNPGQIIDRRLNDLEKKGVKITRHLRRNLTWTNHRLARAIDCWLRLFPLLRARRSRVIHLHLDLIIVPALAYFAGCRNLVLSIHNDEPYYSKLKWKLWFRVLNLWINRFIGITDHVTQYILSVSKMRNSKIRRIYYGVPSIQTVDHAREKLNIPSDAFVVGFIGRLTEQKDLKTLILALKALPHVYGVIIGNGELREELQSFANTHQVKNAHFLGAVADAAQLMKAFDIFCLPSKWEGLGLVLIEAMLARVPIIGSQSGAIPEILGQGRYGQIFETGNVDALVQAIQQAQAAQQNRSELNAQIQRAYDFAIQNFTIDNMARETMSTYQQTLSAHS